MPSIRQLPFGYKIEQGEIVPHPKEAKLVRTIFQQYCCGASFAEITKSTTVSGIPYTAGRSWNKNIIARILENRKYTGEQDLPKIVDAGLFQSVQEFRRAKIPLKSSSAALKYIRPLCSFKPNNGTISHVLEILNYIAQHPDIIHSPKSPASTTVRTQQSAHTGDMSFDSSTDEKGSISLAFQDTSEQYMGLTDSDYETGHIKWLLLHSCTSPPLEPSLLSALVARIDKASDDSILITLKNQQVIARERLV